MILDKVFWQTTFADIDFLNESTTEDILLEAMSDDWQSIKTNFLSISPSGEEYKTDITAKNNQKTRNARIDTFLNSTLTRLSRSLNTTHLNQLLSTLFLTKNDISVVEIGFGLMELTLRQTPNEDHPFFKAAPPHLSSFSQLMYTIIRVWDWDWNQDNQIKDNISILTSIWNQIVKPIFVRDEKTRNHYVPVRVPNEMVPMPGC